MKVIPHDPALDSTIALLREGYDFIARRCDRLGTDIFATRLMLKRAICVRGASAAEMFYGGNHFTRNGAMPQTTMRLLQDKGSVQSLDDGAHRHRKAMFLSILLAPEQVEDLRTIFHEEWLAAVERWQRRDEISLFEEVNLILTRSVVRWSGLPLDAKSPADLCLELSGMVENAGGVGPSTWLALWRRRRTERLVGSVVRRTRSGERALGENAPIRIVSGHRDQNGNLLDISDAAVEIINIVRPVVAIGRYIVFAAMALKEQQQWAERFAAGDETQLEAFTEEVRRLYPFFPFIGGRARETFEWEGYRIRKSDWVILDLHGTNHDPRRFPVPNAFALDRGIGWKAQGYDFVAHGGGDASVTHRCPGEAVTVALMKEAIRLLTRSMSYEIPDQKLALDLSRIPALPEQGLRLRDVRRVDARTG